jgi:hypothetical protein
MDRLKLIVMLSTTEMTELTRGGPLAGTVGVGETAGALHVSSVAARKTIDRRTGRG